MQSALASNGNHDNADYDAFLTRLDERFLRNIKGGKEPLFTTDAENLFATYLAEFQEGAVRQHHNCHACKQFLERVGGLVTIDEQGLTTPAIWNEEDAPEEYKPAVAALARAVRRAKVTGVFLSSLKVLGQPVTGVWRHMAVTLPYSMFSRATQSAAQAMAEKKQDFINMNRALAEFTLPILEQALTLLKTDSLYRAEKVIGPAQFLHDLHGAQAVAKNKANVVWRAIATATAGFCHPRASMVGTLLEDIASGMDFAEVSRRWGSKMHPLQYQRPQAAPDAGAIAQAEKIVAQLGAAGSLSRRFCRLEEVEAIWKPRAVVAPPTAGVFGHLKVKGAVEVPEMRLPPVTMTWEKFSRTVLPEAESIGFYARAARDNYCALVTAVNPDAPPILQWDSPERRNPVSWYVWNGGSSPVQFGLAVGQLCSVSAITLQPSMWDKGKANHFSKGVMFLLEQARESKMSGAALFPEILKSEFHGIRSVIKAYSRNAEIAGIAESTACGIMLSSSQRWEHLFRVTVGGKGGRVSAGSVGLNP